ncbi:MAG: class I SAM-dependent methyltransferase [Candidatus Micrarchaeaceae archaeon]
MNIYKKLEIDSKASLELNKKYYSENLKLDFRTRAKDDERYPKALGSNIYKLINSNYRGKLEIKVLEVGARGIYFEKGLYDEISLKDSMENTDYAKRIEYIVLDISKAAIENARSEYAESPGSYFKTEFMVADILNAKLPKGLDIVIMNELLDDLQHIVVTKKEGKLYEVTFKLGLNESNINAPLITLQWKQLKPLEYRNVYLNEIHEALGEGQAITFSPVIDKLFNNIASVSNEESHLIIHDYFVTGGIPNKNATSLKRVYGKVDEPGILFTDNFSKSLLQVTSDVNLHQVLDALSRNGYAIQTLENYDLFIDKAFSRRRIYINELAHAINALDASAKRNLLRRLGGPELGDSIRYRQLCEALAEKLNSILPGRFAMDYPKIAGKGGSFDIDVSSKGEVLEALYDVYRNSYAVVNPLMNIDAVKLDSFRRIKRK